MRYENTVIYGVEVTGLIAKFNFDILAEDFELEFVDECEAGDRSFVGEILLDHDETYAFDELVISEKVKGRVLDLLISLNLGVSPTPKIWNILSYR